jgi:transposase
MGLSKDREVYDNADGEIVGALHSHRDDQQLLPGQHLMDTGSGSIDAEAIVESRLRYQVDIVGPVMPDTSWAAKEAGCFAHSQFLIDWQAKCVHCPARQKNRD